MCHEAGPTETTGKLEDITRLIAQITAACSDGVFVFRGEPRRYQAVSSGLYREYADDVGAGTPFAVLEHVERQEANSYLDRLRSDGDEMEAMSAVQHYGGKTNLVDFTTDMNIALFFGCDGHYSEDGRIVVLRKRSTENQEFHEPLGPNDRAPAQRSVFVIPQSGIVGGYEEIIIPSELKLPILLHLRQYHGIDHRSVYSGPHGFIKYRQRHWNALRCEAQGRAHHNRQEYPEAVQCFTEAIDENPMRGEAYRYRGVSRGCSGDHDSAIKDLTYALELEPYLYPCRVELGDVYASKRDFERAVNWYDEAIRHVMPVPDIADCHNRRGNAHRYRGDYRKAICDYSEAMRQCQWSGSEFPAVSTQLSDTGAKRFREIWSKARELYGIALCNRGEAYLHLEDWERAREDLAEAVRLGVDVAGSFRADYASIAQFERANGSEVPQDLKILLSDNKAGGR